MAKYRIVKRTLRNGAELYEVQEKSFIFWIEADTDFLYKWHPPLTKSYEKALETMKELVQKRDALNGRKDIKVEVMISE